MKIFRALYPTEETPKGYLKLGATIFYYGIALDNGGARDKGKLHLLESVEVFKRYRDHVTKSPDFDKKKLLFDTTDWYRMAIEGVSRDKLRELLEEPRARAA